MFGAHVLIIRRSKLHYIASGIITPIGVMIPEAGSWFMVHKIPKKACGVTDLSHWERSTVLITH